MRPPGPDPRTARAALQDAQRAHGRGLGRRELNANKEKHRMDRQTLEHPDAHAARTNARLTADDWHQMRTNSAEYFKAKFGGEAPAPEATQVAPPAVEVPALSQPAAAHNAIRETDVTSAAPSGQDAGFSDAEINEAWAAALAPYQAHTSATQPGASAGQPCNAADGLGNGSGEAAIDDIWASAIAKVNAPRAAG